MNKFSVILSLTCSALILLCGCSAKDDNADTSSAVTVETTTAQTTVKTTTEPPVIDRELEPAEGTYVYDNAAILDAETVSECNAYCEWLYETYLINTAVVTVSDLGELTPDAYAANAYNEIYGGKGSGLLLLINNDTYKDYLFKSGSCANAISEADEKETFYHATRDIVSGNYKNGVLRLMKLGENCSEYVFDNAGIFTPELADDIAVKCSKSKNNITVLATINGSDVPDEEICKGYYERRYGEDAGIMIMVDSSTPDITVYSEKALPDNIGEIIAAADEALISADYHSAVLHIINELEAE